MAQTDRNNATTNPPSPPPQLQEVLDEAIATFTELTEDSVAAIEADVVAAAASAAASAASAAESAASAALVDINTLDVQHQTKTAFTTTGSSPTFSVTSSPLYGAYATNERLRIIFNAAVNLGGSTLNRDSLGAKDIKQYDSTGVKVNATLKAGQPYDLEFDGTDYVVLNPISPVYTDALILPGGQITFPTVQVPSGDPNTLDDYEEGSWTGALVNSTQPLGFHVGRYVKIGRVVHILISGIFPTQTDSGPAQITGLPFVPNNNTDYPCALTGSESTAVKASVNNPGTPVMLVLTSASVGVTYTALSGDTFTIMGSYLT